MVRSAALVSLLISGCRSEFRVHDITGAALWDDTAAGPGLEAWDADPVWDWGPHQDTSPPGTDDAGTPDEGSTPVGATDTAVYVTIEEICETAAAVTGYLDAWQTAGDDRVFYCHNGGGANWVFLNASISSCLPHLSHDFDVFPTTGCDT